MPNEYWTNRRKCHKVGTDNLSWHFQEISLAVEKQWDEFLSPCRVGEPEAKAGRGLGNLNGNWLRERLSASPEEALGSLQWNEVRFEGHCVHNPECTDGERLLIRYWLTVQATCVCFRLVFPIFMQFFPFMPVSKCVNLYFVFQWVYFLRFLCEETMTIQEWGTQLACEPRSDVNKGHLSKPGFFLKYTNTSRCHNGKESSLR